jgi:beta-ureidopropionase / N-carbamoyl-L-amino-acid hydrolase
MTRTFRQLRSTIGNFDIGAGQTNVIRHRAVITVDLRNPDDDPMTAAEQHFADYVEQLATRHGDEVAWERMDKTSVVPFHPGLQDLVATTGDDLGLPCVRTMSGAGHDVVLVAGGNGGISHTPREYSNAACANVTDVLANAALRLADQP